jgi:hypothetical protein
MKFRATLLRQPHGICCCNNAGHNKPFGLVVIVHLLKVKEWKGGAVKE